MKRLALIVALACSLPAAAPSAGAAPFRRATPGYAWHFPQDDFAHAGFATEWWYFTGTLAAAHGDRYGFELTFFRVSPKPGTDLAHDLYFTHFTVTDVHGRRFQSWERARRGDWGQAGAAPTGPGAFRLWDENWQAVFDASGPRRLEARWGAQQLALELTPGPRMLNGVKGWSQKGSAPGEASYYYSLPHMQAAGQIDGVRVSGLAWMDHEFATDELSPNQQGWDWMGLHLAGGDLMLFNLRLRNGGRDPHSAGTWRGSDGTTVALSAGDFRLTPTGWWQGYPVAWTVTVPRLGLSFTVSPWLWDQQVRDPHLGVDYWEGAVTVEGQAGGQPVQGAGYLELTGYGKRFDLLKGR